MPKVGSKKFPYNLKGKKAAKSYAKKTGKKEMMMDEKDMKKMKKGM